MHCFSEPGIIRKSPCLPPMALTFHVSGSFPPKWPQMTWTDRSDKGNYLTVFCLFGLIYDVCYELAVIMEFGSISETGWGMFLTQPLGEFLRKSCLPRAVVILRWGAGFQKSLFKEGLRGPLSRECCQQSWVGWSQMWTTCPYEHISFFKRCHVFVLKVNLAPILAYVPSTYADRSDLRKI